jgi:O-antigen/teichoic acid export membrane protein
MLQMLVGTASPVSCAPNSLTLISRPLDHKAQTLTSQPLQFLISFLTIAAGALGVAFMPVLSDRFYKNDRHGMWELSSSLLNILAILMAIVAVIIFVFAKPLISHVVAPGLSPAQLDVAANIMRLLAV